MKSENSLEFGSVGLDSEKSTNDSHYERFSQRIESKLYDGRKSNESGLLKNSPRFSSNERCKSKLFLKARRKIRNKSKWQIDCGTRHEALQRIRECISYQDNLKTDLYPLNSGKTSYEKCDSDSAEEYSNIFQNYWFHSMSEIEFHDVKRNLRLSQLFNELRRQLYQMKQNKNQLLDLNDAFMHSLVSLVRSRPVDAVRCLKEQEKQKTTLIEPLILVKKKCAMESCKNVALPCMPTCVRHVLLCDKQMLFEQCRVKDSNNFQCDRPVMNIKYHYPVCSFHSKPNFALPDFSRREIKFEEVRCKNVCTELASTYKTDTDFLNSSTNSIVGPSLSSRVDAKKRSTLTNFVNKVPTKTSNSRVLSLSKRKEKEKNAVDPKENKTAKNEEKKARALPVTAKLVEIVPKNETEPESESAETIVTYSDSSSVRDRMNLSDASIMDAKTMAGTLSSDFVNGFEINSSSIQSHIEDIINSETSLSADMLIESNVPPNYIQVEEMIEEVEITDDGLDSSELGNQELVHSEDLNAVLKQLPPEAFNELFSEFHLSGE